MLAGAEAGVAVHVVATDVDAALLERARAARYPESSLRDLPPTLRTRAFEDGRLRPEYRRPVAFLRHDVRAGAPDGPFDLVLCRNLVFTYFADDAQREFGQTLVASLRPGGALVVGAHERPPLDDCEPWPGVQAVWCRRHATPHAG